MKHCITASGARRSLRHAIVAVAALVFTAGLGTPAFASRDVVVFAAASLKTALDDISAQYQHVTGRHTVISFAASSALARQIEAGAPADIYISANLSWMDYLQKHKLIKPGTRSTLLGNELVLVASKDSAINKIAIKPGFPLAQLLGKNGYLAMANTDAVPAGKYGKAALKSLGVWPSVKSRIAQAANVRAALALVSRNEAPLGIVYQTDVAADPNTKIVGVFPESSHPPIRYPMAITASSTNPDAPAFVTYLHSAKARPLFEKQGFTVLSH